MKLSPQITLYSVLTACFLLLFCFAERPFTEPDSANHFRRAFQIAHGQLIGKKNKCDQQWRKKPRKS